MVPEDHEGWKLTDEGDEYAAKGSPEAIVYNLVGCCCSILFNTRSDKFKLQVGADGSEKDEIEKLAGAIAKVGLSQCMQVLSC
jgi:hypothetical protein